jgi:hypothetical protein
MRGEESMKKGYYPMDYTEDEWIKEGQEDQRFFNKRVRQIFIMLSSAFVLFLVLLLSGVLGPTM